jgi:nicotinamidase-related amidase
MAAKDPWKPSSYGPSKTALLLLDYEKAHVDMIQDAKKKELLVASTKELLTTARKRNVAVVHCLMDTKTDPPPINKGTEKWHSMIKPLLSANPELAVEYSDFAIPAGTSNGSHESTSYRNPGYMSAFTAEGLLPLLRKELGVSHLIMAGITTSGPVLGTALHATDLNFVVTVVEDASWDPNEQVHRALIDSVIPTVAWVSKVEEAVGYMTTLPS